MSDRPPGTFEEEVPPAPGRPLDVTVKWFNPGKGFGFVTMPDGSQDAFLPMATLRRAGYDDVREGCSMTCEIGAGPKGPLVINILSVDASTAVPPRADSFDHRPSRASQTLEGEVKWFALEKGYGFIMPDDGSKDLFAHYSEIRSEGYKSLQENQRVTFDVGTGPKGPSAKNIKVAA